MLTFEESEWKVYENSLYYASTLCISRTWDENHNPGWHLFSPERPWAEDPGVPCLDFRLTHGNCEIINCVSVCVFNSINRRFPRWLSGRESICHCQRHRRYGFDPWVRKIPWRSEWQPTPVFLLEDPMDRGAWQLTVHGSCKELDMTEHAHMCNKHLKWKEG